MDLIFHNGKIVTMDPAAPQVQALAVKAGVILAAGSDSDILPLAKPGTQVIDLQGRLVLPGFCDSHMHLLSYGYGLEKAALGGAQSLEEMVELGRQFLAGHPELPWVQGRGWNNDRWTDRRMPTRWDLDRISTEVPISFTRWCSHAVVVNSNALSRMGVTKDTPDPDGGRIERDDRGEPLGIFWDEAQELVYQNIPTLTKEDLQRMLVRAGRDALKCGLTMVQSDDYEAVTERETPFLLQAFQELAGDGRLPVRVREQCRLTDIGLLQGFLSQGHAMGQGNDLFRIGPLKLLCDGGLGARTALLARPYADCPDTRGAAVYTQEALDELVETAHRAGMACALHSIGDGALDMCLAAIGRAQERDPRPDMRHSVIHCQVTRPDQLQKLRERNIVAHIQPIFLDYDHKIAGDRVGPQLEKSSYNWRTMADLGVHYACGSDCPVESFDVMRGIYCAVTRKDLAGLPEQGWLPEQALTVEQAVRGFTLGGAYAVHEDHLLGSLEAGKLADMVVLERDIFTIPPEEIKDVRVDMTVLGGRIAWQRSE